MRLRAIDSGHLSSLVGARPKVRLSAGEFEAFLREEIEQSIPSRFEKQVELHSGRLAVKARGRALTYEELNGLANRIAWTILARRGEGEEPVALLLEQGTLLVAAILGALKAGKIYVPAEAAFPLARIALVLEDARPGLVLTDARNAALAAQIGEGRVEVLNVERPDPRSPSGNPGLSFSPERGACIFYTSGSTGLPKGVVDNHRNVLHNVFRYTNSLEIGADDRLTLLQSPSSSGAVSSLFGAVLNGAAVFPLRPREEGLGATAASIAEEGITIYHSVPALFRSLLEAGLTVPGLRVIRLEGDQAWRTDIELYKRHFADHAVLVNGLGATETGLVRQFFVTRETELEGSLVPVGYPVADMNVLLFDEAGAPVEEGSVGEIAVRSRYLAPGYWRQPELTRGAFLPDPAGGAERIYRTGDLGRFRPDGCLEHLGRKDFRVKIRGQTVEPAEVERALLENPAIRQAAVASREATPGNPRLVAYIVPAARPWPSAGDLRRRLSRTLPGPMVPSEFVALEALPLSDNGKVDRRALAEAGGERLGASGPFVAPSGSLERRLAALWEEVLDFRPVGARDDFFELGGDSLAAAGLAARWEQMGGAALSPSGLTEAPTVAELARLLREGRPRPALVPIRAGGSEPPIFFVHDLDGQVLRYAELARSLPADRPVYVLNWGAVANDVGAAGRIESMAARYLGEVRHRQPEGPYFLGGYCFGAVVAFEMAQQLTKQGDSVALLALLGVTPFDFWGLVSAEARERYRGQKTPTGFVVRLAHHAAASRRLAAGGRLRYLARRVMSVVPFFGDGLLRFGARSGQMTADALWRAALDVCALAGLPLPRLLQMPRRSNRLAFTRYSPRTYSGRAQVFLSSKTTQLYFRDPAADWTRLAGGGVEVRVVPGEDTAMLQEPAVAILAEMLGACLSEPRESPLESREL